MNSSIIEIPARRNPAAIESRRENRAAYGHFMDEMRRLKCGGGPDSVLSPMQRDVAEFLAFITLKQGFTSAYFSSLSELTSLGDLNAPSFAGLGKNDLSIAFNGYFSDPSKKFRRAGLAEVGIIRIEERAALESGVVPVSVLLVIADSAQWMVPASGWKFRREDEDGVVRCALACRLRHTPQHPELAEEPDLHDARAAIVSNLNAPDMQRNETACRHSTAAFSGEYADAPVDVPSTQRRPGSRERSDLRNGKTSIKTPGVPKVGTPRARELLNCSTVFNRTVQPLNSSINRSNELLRAMTEQFKRAHGQPAAIREMEQFGAAWRGICNHWPDVVEAEVAELKVFIDQGRKFTTSAPFWLGYYIRRALGVSSWEEVYNKSKESFNRPIEARLNYISDSRRV